MTHKEYADGLRAIAEFFEQHEEISLPHDATEFNYFSANTKKDMALLARTLGSCDKEVTEYGHFHLVRKFGAVTFRAIANREQVCKRVVVGTKEVPAHIIPAKPEQLVPAKKEEIVEWQCEPLLAAEFNEEQSDEGPDPHDAEVENDMERERRWELEEEGRR